MKKIKLENKEYIIDITKDTYSKLDKKGRREYRKQLSKEFKKYFDTKLNEVVSRSISVENLNVIKNIAFFDLVSEARSLYIEGFYYSTVALCGVIGENICRTVVESAEITVNQKKLENKKPLIKLDFSALNKILIGLNLISQKSYRNLEIIRKLRNDYVHGKTLSNITNAKKDAKISINCIITILKNEFKPGR
jgi:hypothetical protein